MKEKQSSLGNHINKKLRIIYTPSSAPNVLITGHQGFLTKRSIRKELHRPPLLILMLGLIMASLKTNLNKLFR
jgi:hypothetical protein